MVIVNRNEILFVVSSSSSSSPSSSSSFLTLLDFFFSQVMVDESLLSDDPNSYVTLTVVRSPGGKGAVQLRWTIDEAAKDDLSPLNGTLHFDEVESASGFLQCLSDSSLLDFLFCSLRNFYNSIQYV